MLGADSLSVDTFSIYEPSLKMLEGWFEEEGFVLFCACNIGQNRVLMLALAKALKTTVYAGTGKSLFDARVLEYRRVRVRDAAGLVPGGRSTPLKRERYGEEPNQSGR